MKKLQTKTIGLFPLNHLVLPGETLRLHVYIDEFKKLINDCFANNHDFVIPYSEEGEISDFGCQVKLVDIERFYRDGRMDIKVKGQTLVRLVRAKSSRFRNYKKGIFEELPTVAFFPRKAELIEEYNNYIKLSNSGNPVLAYDTDINVYEMGRVLNLSDSLKYKLVKNLDNPENQVKILLNELRLLSCMLYQTGEEKFKFYMN